MTRGTLYTLYGFLMAIAGYALAAIVFMQDCREMGVTRFGDVVIECGERKGW